MGLIFDAQAQGKVGDAFSNAPQVGEGGGDYVKQTASALNTDNPLFASAKRKAMEYANSRGLVNSSIGSAAAVDAVTQTAAQLGTKNADANNQFTLNNLSAKNSALVQGFGANNQQGLIGSQLQADMTKQQGQQAWQSGRDSLDRQQGKDILAQQNQNQMGLLDKQQSFTTGQNELDRNQALSIIDKTQNFQSNQSALDRTARSDEFAKTLGQRDKEFFTQNGLNQQKLTFDMNHAAKTLDSANYQNYANMMTAIMDGTNPNKADVAGKLNMIFFGTNTPGETDKMKIGYDGRLPNNSSDGHPAASIAGIP